MNKTILYITLALFLGGCYRTENGLVFGLPDYEKRNIKVTQIDLDILRKTNALLKDATHWNKDASRICQESHSLSLYCALKKASMEVTGKYVHRQPALQEVRFVINDNFKNRWKVHRLADFNAYPDTSFDDVKTVISKALDKVRAKLRGKEGTT